jgi:hypothetical protein
MRRCLASWSILTKHQQIGHGTLWSLVDAARRCVLAASTRHDTYAQRIILRLGSAAKRGMAMRDLRHYQTGWRAQYRVLSCCGAWQRGKGNGDEG